MKALLLLVLVALVGCSSAATAENCGNLQQTCLNRGMCLVSTNSGTTGGSAQGSYGAGGVSAGGSASDSASCGFTCSECGDGGSTNGGGITINGGCNNVSTGNGSVTSNGACGNSGGGSVPASYDAGVETSIPPTRTNPDGSTPPCLPLTCEQQGYNCGYTPNGCGQGEFCGNCISPDYCGGGGAGGKCGHPCIPKTCNDLGYNCGYAGDGCGQVLNCGACVSPQYCGGGGPSICGG